MRRPPIPLGRLRTARTDHRSPHVIRMAWHWLQMSLHRTHAISAEPQMSQDGGSGSGGVRGGPVSCSGIGEGSCPLSDIRVVYAVANTEC